MEIGPIIGVRAVTLTNSARPASAIEPVLEIDPSSRADDETYTASQQAPDRGIEEEDSDEVDPEQDELLDDEQPSRPTPRRAGAHINFFA